MRIKEAGSNALELEIVPTLVATLDEETRAELVNLPKPTVAQKRTGIISTHMA